MDLKKLPPAMLAVLGLGCVRACLTPAFETNETSSSGVDTNTVGPCLSPPLDLGSAEDSTSVGPCLSPPEETTTGSDSGSGSDTGTGSGSDTGTGSGSDTGSGSGSDTGTGSGSDTGSASEGGSTVGPCLAPPPDAPPMPPLHDSAASPPSAASSYRDALERVLARATLPPDVAARLRQRSGLE